MATGGLLASSFVHPQASVPSKRLGFFINAPAPAAEDQARSAIAIHWQKRLASFGWIEGKNLVFDRLYSGGETARLPELVAELVHRQVDVIWVVSTSTAVAAARGTKTIPIVLAGASAYPIECGLIKSYARPGTNVTGVAWFQGIEVNLKLAEYLRQIVPTAKRLAWIVFPADLVTVSGGEFTPKPYYAKVARSLGFEFGYYECRKSDELEPIFAAIRQWRAHGVIVEPAHLSWLEAPRIAALARQARLPSFNGFTRSAVEGGLLGYSPFVQELHEEAFTYVDRIFRGAKASDMPVVMPRTLELSVNLKTAKLLGLTIPQSVLVRADRVIE
jgi:putative ABC transport system substrate-binding protein